MTNTSEYIFIDLNENKTEWELWYDGKFIGTTPVYDDDAEIEIDEEIAEEIFYDEYREFFQMAEDREAEEYNEYRQQVISDYWHGVWH